MDLSARCTTTFIPVGRIRIMVCSVLRIRTVSLDGYSYIIHESVVYPDSLSGARADNYCVRAARERHRKDFGEMLGENSHCFRSVTFATDVPLR